MGTCTGQIDQTQKNSAVRPGISEAWSFNWQRYGDAGLINESKLRAREDGVSKLRPFVVDLRMLHVPLATTEWGCAIAAFLKAKKFPKYRTVGVGSSAGSSAM